MSDTELLFAVWRYNPAGQWQNHYILKIAQENTETITSVYKLKKKKWCDADPVVIQ